MGIVDETVRRRREPMQRAEAPAEAVRWRGRRRWVALGVVVGAAAGALAGWGAGVLSPSSPPGAATGAPPPATAAVVRQDLAATTPVTATLGYAGSYAVTGQGGGKLTSLPSAGQVIRQGQVLYKTDNGSPVVLMYGTVPDWRDMDQGIIGTDVSQLNHDLVHLGYADRADIVSAGWDHYTWETAYGVQRLERQLGVTTSPGTLPLGQVVFEPQALRVSHVTGALGGPADGPVLTATSDRHEVTIPLDASMQSQVKAGDAVSVTLPDGAATPGVVSSVSTVAATTSGSGGSSSTTIPVYVTLADPQAAGTLDEAPVTVNITTQSSQGPVLAVPVTALVAKPGEYVVEVVGPGNARSWVPVTPGIFDDDNGLVQVTGALTPGQRVVVAAS